VLHSAKLTYPHLFGAWIMLHIEPTDAHPIPFDISDAETATHEDELRVAANTASLLSQLDPNPIEMTDEDAHAARSLISGTKDKKLVKQATQSRGAALHLATLLNEYDKQVIVSAHQARTYITNRLLELSACGDVKVEIKALELLGKHSDIGVFTERSEVTITHKTSADLEDAIKERIKRLLNTDTVDVTPLVESLDDELGVYVQEKQAERNQEPTEAADQSDDSE
jgi:hypothetical protein